MENRSFLGTGWGFPPTFSKSKGGVLMTSGREDVEKSLEILLSTRVGERIMQHRYGCNTEELLFEPLNTALETFMQDLIKTAILYFEPRIKLNQVKLTPQQEEGRILILVDYTIKGANSRYNFVYPFYLEEGINNIP